MSLFLVRQPDWLWRTQIKAPTGNEQTRTQSHFFQSETLTLNSCRSPDYACGDEFVIYFTDPCKPIETYISVRKRHPFASYPAAKHPKQSKFAVTNIPEKPVNFFYCSTRALTLVSAIILLTQVPLQKFPFLFISIIPCCHQPLSCVELWLYNYAINIHVCSFRAKQRAQSFMHGWTFRRELVPFLKMNFINICKLVGS